VTKRTACLRPLTYVKWEIGQWGAGFFELRAYNIHHTNLIVIVKLSLSPYIMDGKDTIHKISSI